MVLSSVMRAMHELYLRGLYSLKEKYLANHLHFVMIFPKLEIGKISIKYVQDGKKK